LPLVGAESGCRKHTTVRSHRALRRRLQRLEQTPAWKQPPPPCPSAVPQITQWLASKGFVPERSESLAGVMARACGWSMGELRSVSAERLATPVGADQDPASCNQTARRPLMSMLVAVVQRSGAGAGNRADRSAFTTPCDSPDGSAARRADCDALDGPHVPFVT